MAASSPFDLPPELLDAAGQALAADEPARAAAFAALLAAHPQHAEALRALADSMAHAGRLLSTVYSGERADTPAAIGPYRVLRTLGEGAFGIVHLAEQDVPIRRQLAIKVLRPGAGDRTTLQRFAAERQLLAGFQHPAIANVIDAGELPDGRPWFAMEHVPGVPITTYCDTHQLGVEPRLRLFLALCQGVAHAHARDVVHRDLKPANVLVATIDGAPQPKIIDFGIAKALRETATTWREATATGRVVGTPGYMSPEQQSGDSHRVDARADVFSLGVMLFELLTGTLPWPRDAATTNEPPRPSTRLSADPARAALAAARASEPRSLAHRLRGELDWIVLKALHPEPGQRYADASALAADLGDHLADRPIRARPPSWRQRLPRLLRRHRLALVVAASLTVVGALTVVAITLSAAAQASASERIDTIADAVDRLLQNAGDLKLAELPDADRLREAALRDAATLLQRLDAEPPSDPVLRRKQAQVRCVLASLYHAHGRHRDAVSLLQRAADDLDVLAAAPDAAPELVAQRAIAWLGLATNLFELRQVDASFAASEASIAAFEAWRRDHPDDRVRDHASAWAMHANGLLARKDFAGAVTSFQRSIGILTSWLAAHPDDVEARRNHMRMGCGLVDVHLQRGDKAAAVAAARDLLAALAATAEATAEDRAIVHRRVAGALQAARERDEAAVHWRHCAEHAEAAARLQPRRTHLADLARVANTELALFLYGKGAADEADGIADRAMRFADAAKDESPLWAQCYAYSAGRLALATFAGERFARYPTAAAWLERAMTETAADPARATQTQRALCFGMLGAIRRDLRQPFPVARWQEAVALAREHRIANAGFFAVELAMRQCEAGDLAGARAALAEAAQAGVAATVEYVRADAACRVATGEFAEALRGAEAGLKTDASWAMLRVNAETHLAAVLAAEALGAAAPAALPQWRQAAGERWRHCLEIAEDLNTRCAAELRELYVAQAQTALACLGQPLTDAARELATVLPHLTTLRDRVPARVWNEPLWVAGHRRALRLALTAGDRAGAGHALTQWLAQVHEPATQLDGAVLGLELTAAARAAGDAAAAERGLAAARGAIAAARDAVVDDATWQRLLTHARCAPLRDEPQLAAALAARPR